MSRNERIRVAIAGANGKMGREAMAALANAPDVIISGALVRQVSVTMRDSFQDVAFYTDPVTLLDTEHPDVWLDLTTPERVVEHVDLALGAKVHPVVGATGYSDDDVHRWHRVAADTGVGGLICPNFALGALLMMRFAKEAAKWMQRAEIIELHHDQKKDMPSGTAARTAAQMEVDYEIPIHSIRLPGLVAHQEIIFGGIGETLTIRHDSLSRTSFMPGVLHACRSAVSLTQMVVGLEHLMW